jgi:hypothetical protein
MNPFFSVMKGEEEFINPKQLMDKDLKKRYNKNYRQASFLLFAIFRAEKARDATSIRAKEPAY